VKNSWRVNKHWLLLVGVACKHEKDESNVAELEKNHSAKANVASNWITEMEPPKETIFVTKKYQMRIETTTP